MAEILKPVCAGTMESSDAYVEIEPATNGIDMVLESAVEAQFGDSIRTSVLEVLKECKIENAKVHIKDQGALDCVIRARVETAIKRGIEK